MCSVYPGHEWGRTQSLQHCSTWGPNVYIHSLFPRLLFRSHSPCLASSSSLVLLLPPRQRQGKPCENESRHAHAGSQQCLRRVAAAWAHSSSFHSQHPPLLLLPISSPIPLLLGFKLFSTSSTAELKRADFSLRQSWPSKRQQRGISY